MAQLIRVWLSEINIRMDILSLCLSSSAPSPGKSEAAGKQASDGGVTANDSIPTARTDGSDTGDTLERPAHSVVSVPSNCAVPGSKPTEVKEVERLHSHDLQPSIHVQHGVTEAEEENGCSKSKLEALSRELIKQEGEIGGLRMKLEDEKSVVRELNERLSRMPGTGSRDAATGGNGTLEDGTEGKAEGAFAPPSSKDPSNAGGGDSPPSREHEGAAEAGSSASGTDASPGDPSVTSKGHAKATASDAPTAAPIAPGGAMPTDAQILRTLSRSKSHLRIRDIYLLSNNRNPRTEQMGAGVKPAMRRQLEALKNNGKVQQGVGGDSWTINS